MHGTRQLAAPGRGAASLAQPGDDVVDDRRAFGLVVELVAEVREGPPLDAGRRAEDRRRVRRDEAVVLAVEDERRHPEAARRRRADALLLA